MLQLVRSQRRLRRLVVVVAVAMAVAVLRDHQKVVLTRCIGGPGYLNGAGRGAKRARPIAKKSSGPEAPDDDYQPPGVDDDYQPPGLGAFNIEPSGRRLDEFYDAEEGEEEYEEEFAGDDEYGDEGVEYEEGEEFEGGEYGDEYGDEENEGEFEEESYYEEETEEGSATPSFTNF
jgi:hypothetical protein